MSYQIWGIIQHHIMDEYRKNELANQMVQFCLNHRFAIQFNRADLYHQIKNIDYNTQILFDLADNFLTDTCQQFMEPIYYYENDMNTQKKLRAESIYVKQLIDVILAFDKIENVQLYIVDMNCIEQDIEMHRVKPFEIADTIQGNYIEKKWIPNIKLIIANEPYAK